MRFSSENAKMRIFHDFRAVIPTDIQIFPAHRDLFSVNFLPFITCRPLVQFCIIYYYLWKLITRIMRCWFHAIERVDLVATGIGFAAGALAPWRAHCTRSTILPFKQLNLLAAHFMARLESHVELMALGSSEVAYVPEITFALSMSKECEIVCVFDC